MVDGPDSKKEHRWWIRTYDLVARRFTRWLWSAVIVAALVSGVVAWAITPWKTDFLRYPVGTAFAWVQDHHLVLLVGGIAVASVLTLLTLLRRRTGRVGPGPQAIPLTHEDRRRLLARLRSLYQDIVKQSSWGMPRLELGSTLLYDLALALTERAERDPIQPPPVVVSLSSWAEKRLPLEQWLAEELRTKYQVQRTLASGWLLADRLLPLFDGLDEMPEEARSACIDAINTYRQDHPLPIVVSTRSAEHLSQERKLQLQSAVEVQPLTTQQVQHYLAAGKRSLEAVRAVLSHNPILQELLTTPLLLSVVIFAYRGKAKKDLPQLGTAEEQQRQVFSYYVQRMLERPVTRGRFTPEQTRRWLTWLAQQMQQHQLTEFYIERLQLTWLPTLQARKRFPWLNRLLVALPSGLLGGLLGGLLLGRVGGLYFGLCIGLLFGSDSRLTGTALQPHMFWRRGERERGALLFFRYCRYNWKCAAMCSKRAIVMFSLTPMYLL